VLIRNNVPKYPQVPVIFPSSREHMRIKGGKKRYSLRRSSPMIPRPIRWYALWGRGSKEERFINTGTAQNT
jgi:hypothetical protein